MTKALGYKVKESEERSQDSEYFKPEHEVKRYMMQDASLLTLQNSLQSIISPTLQYAAL